MTRREAIQRNAVDVANEAAAITKVEGYAYDPKTNDWTERVEYIARNHMEAIRWMNFNRDWMKHLRIITP